MNSSQAEGTATLEQSAGQAPEPGTHSATILDHLRTAFPNEIVETNEFRGDLTVTVRRDRIREICRELKENPGLKFDLMLDVCGVDYPQRAERLEVVYHLYSLEHNHRLRLKTRVSEEDPHVDSVVPVWKAANWFEREAFDMLGVRFNGHPNLRRILTHEEFVGHPLRKDYDHERRHRLTTAYDLAQVTSPEAELEEEAKREHADKVGAEPMVINIGPSHPATHGTLRLEAKVDGEVIVDSDIEIGYLHRCFEKMSETHHYQQVIPYTDRLNYCSPFLNGVGYAMAVEKLLGVEVPRRAQLIRVILGEFSRIMDHLVCIGTNIADMGAITNFWYAFRPREDMYALFEACCGSRLTVSYVRIGGLLKDAPPDFVEQCEHLLKILDESVHDLDRLNTRNMIFRSRTIGVGEISAQDAIDYGFTGPCLRASGVAYDVRKYHPYHGYDEFDFDIPVGSRGDTYDRYLVRMEEIRQSTRIIRQALKALEPGPWQIDDRRITLPLKEKVYSDIEDLMNHFKLIMHGIRPPAGEVYGYTEGGNGELGFYVVSDGSGYPYRIKVRPPCFAIFQAFPDMIKGGLIADAIAALGSMNIVAGELDR